MISRIFQSLGNPCKLIEVYIISVFYTVRIRYSIWMAKRTQLKNSRIEPLRRLNKFSIIHPNDWAYSAYRRYDIGLQVKSLPPAIFPKLETCSR